MRHDGDLAAVRFLDAQGLLDPVLVHLVHDVLDVLAVGRLVRGVELLLRPGVGHLLDGHDDVHASGLRWHFFSWPGRLAAPRGAAVRHCDVLIRNVPLRADPVKLPRGSQEPATGSREGRHSSPAGYPAGPPAGRLARPRRSEIAVPTYDRARPPAWLPGCAPVRRPAGTAVEAVRWQVGHWQRWGHWQSSRVPRSSCSPVSGRCPASSTRTTGSVGTRPPTWRCSRSCTGPASSRPVAARATARPRCGNAPARCSPSMPTRRRRRTRPPPIRTSTWSAPTCSGCRSPTAPWRSSPTCRSSSICGTRRPSSPSAPACYGRRARC